MGGGPGLRSATVNFNNSTILFGGEELPEAPAHRVAGQRRVDPRERRHRRRADNTNALAAAEFERLRIERVAAACPAGGVPQRTAATNSILLAEPRVEQLLFQRIVPSQDLLELAAVLLEHVLEGVVAALLEDAVPVPRRGGADLLADDRVARLVELARDVVGLAAGLARPALAVAAGVDLALLRPLVVACVGGFVVGSCQRLNEATVLSMITTQVGTSRHDGERRRGRLRRHKGLGSSK